MSAKEFDPAADAGAVKVSVSDYVATVTLDRQPVNAVTRAMRRRIIEVFDSLSERKDVRVVVLASGCRVFCAGVDLRDRPDPDDPGALASTHRLTRETFNAIRECAKPVIAAVHGATMGFGVALVAACDVIYAADDAQFSMPEINVGLAGGVAMLQDFLPRSKARELILTGRPIGAAELGRLGIVNCVARAELAAAAQALAAEIAAKSPTAVRYAKRSANIAELMPEGDAYKLEQHYTSLLATSKDGLEARQAFLEKRKPNFSED